MNIRYLLLTVLCCQALNGMHPYDYTQTPLSSYAAPHFSGLYVPLNTNRFAPQYVAPYEHPQQFYQAIAEYAPVCQAPIQQTSVQTLLAAAQPFLQTAPSIETLFKDVERGTFSHRHAVLHD
jgi:hypothetical protein